jgi:hypothetical protein
VGKKRPPAARFERIGGSVTRPCQLGTDFATAPPLRIASLPVE